MTNRPCQKALLLGRALSGACMHVLQLAGGGGGGGGRKKLHQQPQKIFFVAVGAIVFTPPPLNLPKTRPVCKAKLHSSCIQERCETLVGRRYGELVVFFLAVLLSSSSQLLRVTVLSRAVSTRMLQTVSLCHPVATTCLGDGSDPTSVALLMRHCRRI